MSMHHCDDCRFLHSQCKCPDISPTWYPSKTHEENMRLREEWYRNNPDRRPEEDE
jgi:hypothetical protein